MAQDGVQTRGGGVARTICIISESRVVLRATHIEFCVNPSFLLGVLLWLVPRENSSDAICAVADTQSSQSVPVP